MILCKCNKVLSHNEYTETVNHNLACDVLRQCVAESNVLQTEVRTIIDEEVRALPVVSITIDETRNLIACAWTSPAVEHPCRIVA